MNPFLIEVFNVVVNFRLKVNYILQHIISLGFVLRTLITCRRRTNFFYRRATWRTHVKIRRILHMHDQISPNSIIVCLLLIRIVVLFLRFFMNNLHSPIIYDLLLFLETIHLLNQFLNLSSVNIQLLGVFFLILFYLPFIFLLQLVKRLLVITFNNLQLLPQYLYLLFQLNFRCLSHIRLTFYLMQNILQLFFGKSTPFSQRRV